MLGNTIFQKGTKLLQLLIHSHYYTYLHLVSIFLTAKIPIIRLKSAIFVAKIKEKAL